jgi:sulfide dehydrogenase cytochrome subunit
VTRAIPSGSTPQPPASRRATFKTLALALVSAPALLGGVALLVATPRPAAAEPPPPGRLLASQCAQCHGTNGNGGFEELAGESAREIYDELIEMKYRRGTESIMDLAARGYGDAELRLIADWFASQPRAGDAGSGGSDEPSCKKCSDSEDKKSKKKKKKKSKKKRDEKSAEERS